MCTLGEFGQSTGGLRKDIAAFRAVDDGVGVGEYGGDGLAGVTLDVHVERIGRLDDSLQLVGCCLLGGRWMEDIFCESHLLGTFIFCWKRGLVLLRRSVIERWRWEVREEKKGIADFFFSRREGRLRLAPLISEPSRVERVHFAGCLPLNLQFLSSHTTHTHKLDAMETRAKRRAPTSDKVRPFFVSLTFLHSSSFFGDHTR